MSCKSGQTWSAAHLRSETRPHNATSGVYMAISACSFRSSSSSSSSSSSTALPLTTETVSGRVAGDSANGQPLTWSVGRSRQLVDSVRDRNGACLGHLFVQLLLLHLFQLVLQLVFVDLVAEGRVVHDLDNLVAERILLPQTLPGEANVSAGYHDRHNARTDGAKGRG